MEGGAPDSNTTAAAVEALGRGTAATRALAYLRRLQGKDGGFALSSGRASDAQSTAWAIQAFLAAGQKGAGRRDGVPGAAEAPGRQLPLLLRVRDDAGLGHGAGAHGARREAAADPDGLSDTPPMGFAVILTIGNEIVSGDVPNTNASWLAKRLEALGFPVRLLLAVPDEIELVAEVVRRHAAEAELMVVTGGLGGTPDDLTREALAAAFGVGQAEVPELAAELRARFTRNPDYAARWAELPVGSEPLVNPLGGAPGFMLENVYVLPGLPAEMEAMWLAVEDGLEPQRADRRLAAHGRDGREPDRPPARRGGGALPGRASRLLPQLPSDRAAGRDRAEVGRRGRARRRRRVPQLRTRVTSRAGRA